MDFEKIIEDEIAGEPPTLYYKHQNSQLIIDLAKLCNQQLTKNKDLIDGIRVAITMIDEFQQIFDKDFECKNINNIKTHLMGVITNPKNGSVS